MLLTVAMATMQLGQTAFDFAARKGHLPCLKLLFAAAQCSQSLNSIPKDDKVSIQIGDDGGRVVLLSFQ